MYYKVLSVVLGIILLAALTYIVLVCVPLHSSNSPTLASVGISSTVGVDPDLIKAWQAVTEPVRQRGRFVDHQKVTNVSSLYRIVRDVDPILKQQPYGFLFGMDKMRELISRYDTYNSTKPADSIHGVRVYMVLNETTIDPVAGTTRRHFDVIFCPVKEDGKNLFDIGDEGVEKYKGYIGAGNPDLFLNTSSPCPDMCNN